MNIDELTAQQQEKARTCKTPEELLALAKEEGVELSDEQIEGISGGKWDFFDECESYTGCKRVVHQ